MSTALPRFAPGLLLAFNSYATDTNGRLWFIGEHGNVMPAVAPVEAPKPDTAQPAGDEQKAMQNAHAPRLFTEKDVEDAIDRDRVKSFMLFARALPADANQLISGSAAQVHSIKRALERAGY